jgi:hypothetical protein
MLKRLTLLTGTLGLTLLPLISAAIAAPIGFTTHQDDKGNVWFGGPNNGTVAVTIGNTERTRNLKADACGLIILRGTTAVPLPATFSVAGSPVNPATLPQQLLPKCSAAGVLEEARTANFKTVDGKIVIVSTPNATPVMTWLADLTRNIKTNACGFGKLANSTTKPFSGSAVISIGSDTPVTYSNIPVQPTWKCDSKTGITYKPLVPFGS